MLSIASLSAMIAAKGDARRSGKRVGLVPTMGALHEGHLSLVRAARARCDLVIASIFVNPKQFGPSEDLAKYPRTLERDSGLLAEEKCDYVFCPSVEEMYPPGSITTVIVEGMNNRLDGRSRPGHFNGVTTVVAKLFNIVQPDSAFFGQKDAAQAAIIRKMVRGLNFPLEIVVCPIIREPDGLAMSSRNVYLSPEERKHATVLYRSLLRVQALFEQGEHDSGQLVAAGKEVIAGEPGVRLDYFEAVNPDTLESVPDASGALVAVAAHVGTTRLIDNVLLGGK